jgi:hypothetical protein
VSLENVLILAITVALCVMLIYAAILFVLWNEEYRRPGQITRTGRLRNERSQR